MILIDYQGAAKKYGEHLRRTVREAREEEDVADRRRMERRLTARRRRVSVKSFVLSSLSLSLSVIVWIQTLFQKFILSL